MQNIIKKIENKRIQNKELRSNFNFIKNPLIFIGNFVVIWYLTRDSNKGIIIFQFFKGLCISIKKSGLNFKFVLRNVIDNVIIEQNLFFWNINNVYILLKFNHIKYYRSNKLFFLRKKKRKKSKFVILVR